jgi:hypothetical protein
MAAIAYPRPSRQPAPRRHLTLVPAPVPRRQRASIYWRRRVLVVAVLVLAVLAARAALGVLGGGPLATSGAPAAGGGASAVYVVQPGDTWWSIARHLQPAGDVRDLVDRLAAGHDGAALQPGERLALR